MTNHGWVYVLLNPALGGLLKIGKTTREPSARVAELSAATGVPTPFILAYECETHDCDLLERIVHQRLSASGYRYAERREFFTAPLHVAVKAIHETSLELERNLAPASPDVESSTFPEAAPLWATTEAQAEQAFSGSGDSLQDFKRALKLFEDARVLGSPTAALRLGQMLAAGQGTRADAEQAAILFQAVADEGNVDGLAELGLLYDSRQHVENARKCWRRYFSVVTPKAQGYDKYSAAYRSQKSVSSVLTGLRALKAEVNEMGRRLNALDPSRTMAWRPWGWFESARIIVSDVAFDELPLDLEQLPDLEEVRRTLRLIEPDLLQLRNMMVENQRRRLADERPLETLDEWFVIRRNASRNRSPS